jgi:NTP pyrophosphatase (non-canonical NTP hydrolase)
MNLSRIQEKVWRWCKHTFDGIAQWNSDKERAYRFFEEAGELFQAMGMTREDALKIVDYVYGRPVGEKPQEVGGVMITLLALCSQQNIDVEQELFREYTRITKPEIMNKIRSKQIAKNTAFV